MNCAECKELLVAYLEGLLAGSEKQAVERHVNECVACRTELKGLQTLQQRLVDNGKTLGAGGEEVVSPLEDQVMNRVIREQSARLKAVERAGMGLRLRRLIMKSAMVKIAAAAVVVLAVIGALSLWTGTKNVALADVVNKVEQVRAFMYKMTMHISGSMPGMPPGGVDSEATALIANDYGMRMETTSPEPTVGQAMNQVMYMLPQQKMVVTLLPALKKYLRMEFDDEMFEKRRRESNDPRLMLKEILKCQYTDLGRTVLDGVEVQGFQTTDPAYAGGLGDVDVKVWVDVKTELPVRMDLKIKMSEQMEMEGTMHDFQWDVPVSAEEFNPVIPADYTAAPGDGIKMPSMTEETALNGLRLCVELKGEYPKDLNMVTLMQTAMEEFKSQPADGAKPQSLKDVTQAMEERTKKVMDKLVPIQAVGGFYTRLVQEKKEPAYYGNLVKPGEAALVLLRWKMAENQYRVIFGDLHALTVDAATLATLEAALPK